MGGRNAAISPEQDILGQLDWLKAELEAQRPFLGRIPEVQLTAQPLVNQPSLIGFYQEMLSREGAYLEVLSVMAPDSRDDTEDIGTLLDAILACRTVLLEQLESLPKGAWQKPVSPTVEEDLMTWAYGITLRDGETLRRVAERLHESQLSLGGTRPDGP